ncbi:MAG TPA: sugar ABC transporter permease, partial [Solirubrobacteraceae bacterium]|nr:sugar ABC transporter permease [Solirubrobacteraceae bacterium]
MSTTQPTGGDVGADEALPTAVPPEEEKLSPGAMLKRLAQGELGSLRVVIVLAIVWIIFAIANDRFLTAVNLTNLALQIAAVGTISVG